jgi:protein involved in polysaccharide export with SLBB domain
MQQLINMLSILSINTCKRLLPLPAVLFILFIQGCASSGNLQENVQARSELDAILVNERNEEYVISAGDQIEISVWGYEEFDTERTVTGRGVVTVPLIGEVEARGLNKEEFTGRLKDKLSEYIESDVINVSVSITSTRGNSVSVLGSVGRPDNYELLDEASLFEVLSRAGGTTDDADLRSITIYRQGNTRDAERVNMNRFLQGDNPSGSGNVSIYPGDIIYIPQEENMVRELSTFMRDVVLLFGMFRIFN